MENRVKVMLKLLGEEADSFGKRAEMYYRTRPEVISHVEQVYRAYRALVERYDHISKELHKANHSIATACPEQVQYAMLEEDDDSQPKAITPINSHKIHKSTVEEILKRRRLGPSCRNKGAVSPHMSKEDAEEEIRRLQKAILVLQTEKEYVKSSYETGIARYWEIDKQIADTQEEICHIQDKFDAHAAIDDDQARGLMTATALRSCQDTVSRLVHNFEELIRIAAMESEETKSLRACLYAMNGNNMSSREADSTDMPGNTRAYPVIQEILELQPIYESIDNIFANSSESSAEEIAESVDGFVDKVMNLELKFPKLSAQIKQLKQEKENLKNELDGLQDEMSLRDDPTDLNEQLKLLEDELNRFRVLERSIIEEEVSISTAFYEIFSCITDLSKALGSIVPKDPYASSFAVGGGTAVSVDGVLEYFMEENILTKNGEFRDEEGPTKTGNLGRESEGGTEVINDTGTVSIHGSKNGSEEKVPLEKCLMQVRYQKFLHSDNHINPFVSSESESAADNSGEGNTGTSSKEVCQSSSCVTNKIWDMRNDGSQNFAQGEILKGEHPLEIVSQTHVLYSGSTDALGNKYGSYEEGCSTEASESLMEVAEGSHGGRNNTQFLKNISDGNFFTRSSGIKGERHGDDKSQHICWQISLAASSNLNNLKEKDPLEESSLPEATCFSGADKSLESRHTNEAKSVEELLKQPSQFCAPQNIEILNKCSQVESLEEDACNCISLCHVDNIKKTKNRILVDVYSSETRDETYFYVPAKDSEEYEGLDWQVSEAPADSENMTSDIFHGLPENKSLNGREFTSKETASSNHGGSSQHEKSNLIEEDVPASWQEFLLDGIEGRETILLADYTSVLRNYKETKRKLTELEKKNKEHLEETKAVIRELKNANSMKYVEIQSLRNLVDSSETSPGFLNVRSFQEIDRSNGTLDREISTEEANFSDIEEPKNTSLFQAKFRSEIDALVEENLQYLLRYSMACHHMQEFERRYQEVQNEMEDTEDKKTGESDTATKPEPVERKLRELRTELDVWLEQNALLDQEVQVKSTSLCRLQDEIAEALCGSSEVDRARFTPYEAAKFQGEVLNMQQSNYKIESELQVASERMRGLQAKVNDALRELHDSFELSSRQLPRPETECSYQKQFKHFPSRTRVPLRNFLFGTKRKKSVFACINPTLQKNFSDL